MQFLPREILLYTQKKSLGILNLFTLHKLNLLYKEIWVVFVATKFLKSRQGNEIFRAFIFDSEYTSA